ncbi:hypothetical protein Bca52824_002659 [Brassica carinata]|uniref:Uncharacterized protein n=1 Tax=Brassica carinata TaxID=52824 RepID=A0A8X8BAR5_BRACI|nr:hypothetical protein Bca52824_002659 [Brassica carinata]
MYIYEESSPSQERILKALSSSSKKMVFHLSYNMLLNQLQGEDGDTKNLLSNSFFQLHAIADIQKKIKALKEVRDLRIKAYKKVHVNILLYDVSTQLALKQVFRDLKVWMSTLSRFLVYPLRSRSSCIVFWLWFLVLGRAGNVISKDGYEFLDLHEIEAKVTVVIYVIDMAAR